MREAPLRYLGRGGSAPSAPDIKVDDELDGLPSAPVFMGRRVEEVGPRMESCLDGPVFHPGIAPGYSLDGPVFHPGITPGYSPDYLSASINHSGHDGSHASGLYECIPMAGGGVAVPIGGDNQVLAARDPWRHRERRNSGDVSIFSDNQIRAPSRSPLRGAAPTVEGP